MWSYSGDPRASVRDAVRFEVQDTNSDAQLLTNEEIEYAIREETSSSAPSEGEVLSAAARCMEALSRLFRMQADTEVGSLKADYVRMAAGYEESALRLRQKASGLHAPWAGGMSESERAAWAADTDLAQPSFRRHLFDSPFAGKQEGLLEGGLIVSEGES